MVYETHLTDMEISWIIDSIVSGKATKDLLNGFSPGELEKILILVNEKIKVIEESKPVFPEAHGISPEVLHFERLMGLPPMRYFSGIIIGRKYI